MPRGSSPPAPAAASNHPHNTHLDVAVTCLWILTPLSATVSLIIVCIAMTTNHWLHTEEKMNNPNYNGTGEKDYLSKYTVSGLWTLCYTNREYRQHCFASLRLIYSLAHTSNLWCCYNCDPFCKTQILLKAIQCRDIPGVRHQSRGGGGRAAKWIFQKKMLFSIVNKFLVREEATKA